MAMKQAVELPEELDGLARRCRAPHDCLVNYAPGARGWSRVLRHTVEHQNGKLADLQTAGEVMARDRYPRSLRLAHGERHACHLRAGPACIRVFYP